MKLFFIILTVLLTKINTFKLPEINIKNTFFDILIKNNLKEFLIGFLGIKESKEC